VADGLLPGLPRERSRQRVADRQQIRDQEILAWLDAPEKLEARAAELRALARKRLTVGPEER
jgi:hypothetical protein